MTDNYMMILLFLWLIIILIIGCKGKKPYG